MASEFITLGSQVYFGAITTNPSGGALQNADATPQFFVYKNNSDTIVLNGPMAARTSLIGTYRSDFPVSAASGFSTGDYVEIQASALVNSTVGRALIKSFVIDNPFNANIIQYGGSGLNQSKYIEDKVWNALSTNYTTNLTMGSGLNKIIASVYYAAIKLANNAATSQNEYGVIWFKDGFVVGSGSITNPAISVFDATAGTALFQDKKMNYASTTLGALSYIEGTSRVTSGVPYEVRTSGLIDNVSQTWRNICALDVM